MSADATTYLLGAVALVVAALVHFHLKAFSYWSSRGIPGPTPWPIFGTNIYYFFKPKIEIDRMWCERYGKTYGFYEGYLPLLRTTDSRLIKQIYVKQFNSFTDRNGRFIHGPIQNNFLLWSKGAKWTNQRALVSPMFSSAKMRLMFGPMMQCVDDFLRMVKGELKPSEAQSDHQAGAESTTSQVTLSKQHVSALTLDVIATCFFSLKQNNIYKREPDEMLKRTYDISFIKMSWFILWTLIPHQVARYFGINVFQDSKFAYFERLGRSIVNERRRANAVKKNDIIQAFLDAKLPETYEQVFSKDDEKEAHYSESISHEDMELQQQQRTRESKLFKQFTDTEITGQMVFMLFAGFETTAALLGFSLYELAHQPQTQKQLFNELKSKFGAEQVESKTFDFTQTDHSELIGLRLLDAFVSETLRLYSPLVEHNRIVTEPTGVDLPISEDKTIHLPKGMPISTNGYILQRDPDYYERPNEFDLTRFLPENRDKLEPCTFMPFGVGPRHCVGMRFALLEIKLALSKLIMLYHVSPGPNSHEYPPKYWPNPIFLQFLHSDFTLTPRRA